MKTIYILHVYANNLEYTRQFNSYEEAEKAGKRTYYKYDIYTNEVYI